MTTPAPPQTAQTRGKAAGAAAPAPAAYPFPVGMYDNEAQDGGQFSLVQTSAAQQFPIYNMTPTGWVRGCWFDFSMVVTGQATQQLADQSVPGMEIP